MPSPCFLAADHDGVDLAFARRLAGAAPLLRACYIGAAHGDHGRWAKATIARLGSALGCPVDAPRLSDPHLDVTAARLAIGSADALFFDGGDTVALVEHAAARGLTDVFRAARSTARLVLGVSAGACALGPFTIGYDAEDRPRIARCFAMDVPFPLDVHSEDDDWSEMRALLELTRGRQGLAQHGVVIPTGSALVISADGTLRSYGLARCERRGLSSAGAWHIDSIPQWAEPA